MRESARALIVRVRVGAADRRGAWARDKGLHGVPGQPGHCLSMLWLWLSLSLTLSLSFQVTVFHEDTVVYSATYDYVYDQHSEQVRKTRG